jgi:hypothetical protein
MHALVVLWFTGFHSFSFAQAPGSDRENPGEQPERGEMRVLFLHHSTGQVIWQGGVPQWFEEYNEGNSTDYQITSQVFPKRTPYGWDNYPYDYWNIWVSHAGDEPFMEEPTLEILTRQYDVIIWKHCFPVAGIREDAHNPDISSPVKRIENYRLQYDALKEKMRQFPECKFIVWTGPAQVRNVTLRDRIVGMLRRKSVDGNAERMREFCDWVRNEWDEAGDNIYIWDLWKLETECGMYLKDEYAAGPGNSHPSNSFARRVAPLFCQRIVDVIEGRGDSSSLTGE